MDWIVFFLIFLSFPILYSINKNGYYVYSLLFPYVGYFILNKIGYSLAYTIINAELLAFIIVAMWQGVFLKYKKIIFIYFAVYLSYLFLLSVFQNVPFLIRWNDYKSPLVYFLWACTLQEDIREGKVSVFKLKRFFCSFLIFELVLCSLQYIFEPIRYYFFNVNYVGLSGDVKDIRDDYYGGLMCGTFMNVTMISNILVMCFVICSNYFLSRRWINPKSLFLIISTLFVIMLSGIKASFLLAIVFFIILLIRYKQLRMLYIMAIFAIVFLLSGVVKGNGDTVSFESGGMARSMSLFSITDQSYLKEQTTLSMSFAMLPHVLQNPLFGVGSHYKGGYNIEGTNFTIEDYSFTDAMFFFEIAEIGIIGLLIYLWPLWKFMIISKVIMVDKSQYLLLFVLLILSTIVDAGFMSNNYILLFFFSTVFFMVSPKSRSNKLGYE